LAGEGGIRPPSRHPLSRFALRRTSRRFGGSHRVGEPTFAWLANRSSYRASREPTFALRATVGNLRENRERRLAERVGFAPSPSVENKELKEFSVPQIRSIRSNALIATRIEHAELHRALQDAVHRRPTRSFIWHPAVAMAVRSPNPLASSACVGGTTSCAPIAPRPATQSARA